MMIETVAVLMPTRGRPEQMARNVKRLLECSVPDGYELLVLIAYEGSDLITGKKVYDLSQTDRVVPVIRPDGLTAVEAWNLAASYLTFPDWYVLGADDIAWHEGWLEFALHCARENNAQVIGLNDGHTNLQHYAPHYMVHRDFFRKHLGGVFIPQAYQSWWFDREICERAASLGVYAPCPEAMAEHLHPDWNTAPDDETYQAGKPHHDADKAVYWQRTGRI